MADANLDLLRQPLSRDLVKQREGAGRQMLDYVEYGDVNRILLDASNNRISWEVLRLEFVSDGKSAYWLCQGRLGVEGCGKRDGIGTHQALDVESPKAAETDAFKRAAVKFGVALDLYDKDKAYRRDLQQPQQRNREDGYGPAGAGAPVQPSPAPRSPGAANGNGAVATQERVSTATNAARYMQANGQEYPGAEGYWHGPGQCPKCHAPQGKRHGRVCLQ